MALGEAGHSSSYKRRHLPAWGLCRKPHMKVAAAQGGVGWGGKDGRGCGWRGAGRACACWLVPRLWVGGRAGQGRAGPWWDHGPRRGSCFVLHLM